MSSTLHCIDRLSTDVSVDISVEYRSICRSTYRSTVGRYVDRNVSVDISTDVYRPSDGRHIDRLSADISVDIAADTRPICRPLTVGGVSVDCRWYIGRVSTDSLRRRACARNVSFRISLQWLIHIINSVDKTKLSYNISQLTLDCM